jgi:putative transposase
MNKSHIIKLYPTNSQRIGLVKSCGVARFAYNWALDKWQTDYKNGITQSAYSLVKYLNSIKRTEFPWMQETSKSCSQYAIHNLEKAYKKMWKEKTGYPKFKKRGGRDSFVSIESQAAFRQRDYKIKLPKIGWVKCAENVRFNGKINNVVVKRVSDNWFAVVSVNDESVLKVNTSNSVVGIDFGIKTMMVLSDGTTFENPKALSKNFRTLKRLQRSLDRKILGSNNRNKAKIKVSRKHYRISNIRKNAIHQATSYIVKNYDNIIIESLNPINMVKNHNLANSIQDVSFGEISRQLSYKALWYGKDLVKADTWFPSSKICSGCGNKKSILKLSERTYKCECCGLKIDRDLNAAINLANYSPTVKTTECEAFGEGSSVAEMQYSPSMNKELITIKD